MTAQPKMTLPKVIRLRMQQSDIDSAVCNSQRHCAIAQTIYRQMQVPIGRVCVTTAGVSIATPENDYRNYYKTPHKACRLVCDIDAGKPVQPINFTLRFAYRHKITPVDPVRKHQVNQARREHTAMLAVLGQKPKTYSRGRYGI